MTKTTRAFSISKAAAHFLVIFCLAAIPTLGLAQGQGSWGGAPLGILAGIGLFGLALVAGVFYWIGGKRGLLLLVALFVVAWVYGAVDRYLSQARTYKAEAVAANFCVNNAYERFFEKHQFSGVQIFIDEESRTHLVVPQAIPSDAANSGVSYVQFLPETNALSEEALVTIKAAPQELLDNYLWKPVRTEVTVMRISTGAVLSERLDQEEGRGSSCLGDTSTVGIERFLRKATNRKSVLLPADTKGLVNVETTSVSAVTSKVETGTFSRFSRKGASPTFGILPPDHGCRLVIESGITGSTMRCDSDTTGPNFIVEAHLLALQLLPDSWLAIVRHPTGSQGSRVVYIEQRLFNGQYVRRWVLNFPLLENAQNLRVDELQISGNRATASLLWNDSRDSNSQWDPTYANRARIQFNLPGLK
jgi:hypothetical protein